MIKLFFITSIREHFESAFSEGSDRSQLIENPIPDRSVRTDFPIPEAEAPRMVAHLPQAPVGRHPSRVRNRLRDARQDAHASPSDILPG